MDRTTMEKPEALSKNFSLVVSGSTYKHLLRMSHLSQISLGAMCREIFEIIPYNLYAKLKAQAFKEQVPITKFCRQILEKAVEQKSK